LRGLSHLARALRHPRHLPLVRRIGRDHHRHLRARTHRRPPPLRRPRMSGGGHGQPEPTGKALAVLALGALGIVYGDIGTSPLYALKEAFIGSHAIALSKANVLGVLSLIFWSLNFVVTLKYLSVVMRADNRARAGSWRCW